MMQPNWFDLKYQDTMRDMTPEACLSLLCSDPKVIAAVKNTFAHVLATPVGPNKAQALRMAVCEALQ